MTQHEIIPMLIGFGLVILFGLLIYYIRHLQNSHAKERAFIINDWQNRFLEICQSLEAAKEETKAVKAQLIDQEFLINEAERWKHTAGQEEIKKIVVIDREKVVSESLADTKRLLDLELQDREQHEAIIDQQNAMILELKGMESAKKERDEARELARFFKENLDVALDFIRIIENEVKNATGGFRHHHRNPDGTFARKPKLPERPGHTFLKSLFSTKISEIYSDKKLSEVLDSPRSMDKPLDFTKGNLIKGKAYLTNIDMVGEYVSMYADGDVLIKVGDDKLYRLKSSTCSIVKRPIEQAEHPQFKGEK